jgi:hypothetical protein
VSVDGLPPTTEIALTPSTPDGANGWYTQPVGALVSASDAGSGVDETRCAVDPATVPVSFDDLASDCPFGGAGGSIGSDGIHDLYAASRHGTGNSGSVVTETIRLDGTAPDVSCRASSLVLGGGGSVVADITDATSGPASGTASAPADTASVGSRTASISGADMAGNTASTSCPYTVGYRVAGPIGLKSMYRVGSAVPVRLGLATADGTRIPDATARSVADACGVRVALLGGGWICASYTRQTDEFVVALRIPRTQPPGAATILVEVRAGSVVVNTIEAAVTLR